jgi:hypothetical protein
LKGELASRTTGSASFVVVFTTVPKNKMSAELVLELYIGLRWQNIKRDKSITNLDRLPTRRPDTVYTWICAKLLLVQVGRKMASSQMAIPPCGLWSRLLAHDCERAHQKAKASSCKEPAFGRESRQRILACDDMHVASHLCGAFSLGLANVKVGLERFLAYLARWTNRKHERQAIVFRSSLSPATVAPPIVLPRSAPIPS